MTKKAVIYARVSTEEQAREGKTSIDYQIQRCGEYAASHGFAILEKFADSCSGAIPIFERPQGDRVLEICDSRKVDAVIIYTTDRLSRDPYGIDSPLFKKYLDDKGVELHFVDTGIVGHHMTDMLLQAMKTFAAAEERVKFAKRSKQGRDSKARGNPDNGLSPRMVMTGHPPYGYRREGVKDKAKMFVYEPEAEIVRSIFNWYTNGASMSLRAIISKLEGNGIPTPQYRKNASKYWTPTTIRGILMNEIYAGRTYYGKTRVVKKHELQRKGKRVKQPQDKWIPIDVPELAIIDKETYKLAQKRLERNKQLIRHAKHDYLLSGFFRCGACGNAMTGVSYITSSYKQQLYRCCKNWQKPPCQYKTKSISLRIAESKVWEWFVGLIQDDEKFDEGLTRMEESRDAEIGSEQERLDAVIQMIDKVDKKINRLMSHFGDEEDEIIATALKNEVTMQAKQKEGLIAEREQLVLVISRRAISPDVRQLIKKMVEEIRKRLENATFDQKRELFVMVDMKIVFRVDVEGRWLDVSCGLKPDGDVIKLCHSPK